MNIRRSSMPALMAALLVLALTGCGKSPEQHLEQGRAFMEKGDYKAATLELKSTLQEQPKNRDARLMLGKAYLASDAYAEAEKELAKARELGVNDDLSLPLLAKALLRQGQPKKVIELAVPTSGLSPQSQVAFQTIRASALLALDKRAEAESAIHSAMQIDAQYPELLLLKARLALVDKKPAEAMQLADASLRRDAKFADALYLKAALLKQDGKEGEAIKLYQQIVGNDPKQVSAHLGIAEIQVQAGKLEVAEKSIQAAEKIAGNTPQVKYSRGVFELRRGKPKEANDALLQVLKVIPDYQPAVLAQAMASFGLQNYEQSLKSAQKVMAQSPDNAMASRMVAASQMKMGDSKAALATVTLLLKSHSNDPRILNLAAEIFAQNKDYNKSMEYLDRAIALAPDEVTLKTQRAQANLRMGNDKQALADFEKAANLSEKPGQADLALVMLRLKNKEYDQALVAIAALEKKLPNNPFTLNLRAAALIGKQDRAGARKLLEQALASQPNFVSAAVNLASLDVQDKNFPAANKRFESVLAHDPNNLQAIMALADLAALEKKEADYVKWLEKAIKAHSDAMPPRERLARYYLAKKDNGKAIDAARQALKANPESKQALALLSSVQLAAGAKAEAITGFTALVEKDKASPNAHFQLAYAQLADKQLAAARTNLNRALELKPDFVSAQDALIQINMTENKPDAALQIARQIQQQNTASPLGFDREGDIHFSQKHYAPAIKAYDQALSKEASSQRFMKLHRAMMISGDNKGADKRMSNWLGSHPKDLAAQGYAAQVFMNAGRNREAIGQYETLLKSAPNNAMALNNLATLYQQAKDGRALATAEQAVKLAPDHPGILDTLGWILVEQGQLPRAVELLRKSVEKAPKAGVLHYHLGVALSRNGDKANARKELEAAIASGQKFPELEDAKAMLKTL
jgi:putative PEP-CTERM system TPR-repeat lipoprotein